MREYLEAGKIVSTHGVRGEVRVEPWCDSIAFLKRFKRVFFSADGSGEIAVEACRAHGSIALMKLKGVDDVEAAALLRNKLIYISRADARLSKNDWFIQDLIGCTVFDADNEAVIYGKITDVSQTGANDVWHISDGKRETLVPAIKDVVVGVQVEQERVVIRPLKGLFDDD